MQQHRKDVWAASGEELERWWRARERVVIDPYKGLATSFEFDVREPGRVRGVKLFVTHPVINMAPKSVKAASPNAPLPEIKPVDAYRSALVFSQELKAGHYAYQMEF